MEKTYRLAADQVEKLIKPMGGCVASDRITVDGARVGSMVRMPPDSSRDSGRQFFAGDETDAHFDEGAAHAVFDVNTICNYDRDIIPFLYALPGSVFERDATGLFVEAEDSRPDPEESDAPAGVQVVRGLFPIGDGWSIFLPTPFRQRVDAWKGLGAAGSLPARESRDPLGVLEKMNPRVVLWRPGLTLFVESRGTRGAIREAREAEHNASIPERAFDRAREDRDDLTLLSFRYRPEDSDAMAPVYVACLVGASGDVEVSCYFDREDELPAAIGIVRTVRPVGLA